MPDASVCAQIDALNLDAAQPLIICDADEVLLCFVAALEDYLEGRGLWLDLQSYALSGNIKERSTDAPVPADQVPALLEQFFAARTHDMAAVPGAAEALEQLGRRARIVVLTNAPLAQRAAREHSLRGHRMDYPVVANTGPKGPAVRYMAAAHTAPVFFLDDIAWHLTSVAQSLQGVYRIHLVADARLARLAGKAEDSHHRAADWPCARRFIEERLAACGFA